MEYTRVETASIKPYEINNKIHTPAEVEKLARSLDEFGWTQPICIDENNVILAGHRRFLAAQLRGHTEVPVVIVAGLSEEKKRAYRLVDNKLSADAHWDYENINEEMAFLAEADVAIVDELLKDFEDKQSFTPNLNPETGSSTPTEEEIRKKEAELEARFKSQDVKLQVCCPQCGHEFGIDK